MDSPDNLPLLRELLGAEFINLTGTTGSVSVQFLTNRPQTWHVSVLNRRWHFSRSSFKTLGVLMTKDMPCFSSKCSPDACRNRKRAECCQVLNYISFNESTNHLISHLLDPKHHWFVGVFLLVDIFPAIGCPEYRVFFVAVCLPDMI